MRITYFVLSLSLSFPLSLPKKKYRENIFISSKYSKYVLRKTNLSLYHAMYRAMYHVMS